MTDKHARYITTTLPYVNADPHIGFALEVIQADTLARYFRLMGDEVFFNTGTDEHGQKIAEKADQEGKSRQAYVDHFANEFQKLKTVLNLSYDNFIRTTDESHKQAAQEIWRRCLANGDIYKKKYSGLYCVGDEMFLRESDLVDGRCPNHPTMEPQLIEEENYFFALSKYQSYLEEYLNRSGSIVPEWRREEALNFVKGGLEDFSISREKSRLDWGIAVPEDENQVMYVWFDALTNYISTLGWPTQLFSADATKTQAGEPEGLFQKFWVKGETLQLAGKDQVRFQSIMWQAMLKSAGVKATDKVFYHGFITSGGQKMSKSIGNVISPYELVSRYGTDATRYLLLRHVHPFDDSDVTWERLDEWYTANLVNGLGNLVARVMKMSETYLTEPVTTEVKPLESTFTSLFDAYDFQKAMDLIFEHIQKADLYIQENEPFKKIKSTDVTEVEEAKVVVKKLVQHLQDLATYLEFSLPETAKIIKNAVLTNKKPENLFARLPETK
jgi:methionyl-tRNA synthetase